MTILDFALFYRQQGLSVIPIKQKDKRPLIKWEEFQGRQATEEEIRAWWKRWPNANIAIVTGAISNLVVLDEDGPEGRATIEANGGDGGTATVRTARGRHYYYRHPGGNIRNFARKLPGLDLRGDGGYVAAPPSIHETGTIYEWIGSMDIVAPPAWLLERLQPAQEPVCLERVPDINREHLNGHSTSPDQARRFIDGCIRSEIEKIHAAADGEKHTQILKSSTYLAGYIGTGVITAQEIEETVFAAIEGRAKDKKNARDTIRDGIKYGTARPLEIPPQRPLRMLRGPRARAYIERGESEETAEAETGAEAESDATASTVAEDDNPYGVQNGCIVFALQKNSRQGRDIFFNVVADFAAHITEEITGEDGESIYKIKGRTPHGRVFHVEISSKKFNDPRTLSSELSAAAGAQFPVRAGMEKHMPTAVKKLTDDRFERAYSFDRTGWAEVEGKKVFIIPGNEPERTTIHLPRKLPFQIDREGADLMVGLEALETLLRAQLTTMTTVAAAFAFQAPLSALCGWRGERYCLFISGRSGSLKSSWAQAMMCLYGPNFLIDDFIIKWGEGATRVAIMLYASHAHDMPLLLDNYKPNTGRGAIDFVNIIHNILEGSDRDRGTQDAKLNEGRLIWTWPVVTGEDVPTTDAASLARILVVPFSYFREDFAATLKRAQNNSKHLCAVGGMWLEWLLTEEGNRAVQQVRNTFDEQRTRWGQYLREQQPDMVNPLRVASNLASNSLTWWAMGQCPALRPIVREYDRLHAEGLSSIASMMASYTFESLEAIRYLAALRELLATGRCLIINRNHDVRTEDRDRLIGYEGADDDIFVLPDAARKAVLSHLGPDGLNHLSDVTLRRQLQSLGAIASTSDAQLLKVIKVGGKSIRCLHLTGASLQVSGGDVE